MSEKKTIVVTGGAGFVGAHLCRALQSAGHTVISLDNYFTGSRDNHCAGVEYREGHTKDIERLIPETPDLVYHLGEYSRVEKSFDDPTALVWDLNIAGTFAVLEFCRKRGAKIVYAGSSTKFADDGLGRNQSPYAWTKAANSELVKNYGEWFGVPFAIAYFYNVFGPRERGTGPYASVIGIWLEQASRGEPLTVIAPGTQRRNFTHVDDIVSGLILIGEKGSGDEYGIGNDRAYSVSEAAALFGREVLTLPERKGNRMNSSVDSSKLRALGWKPQGDLESYVRAALAERTGRITEREKRVLVFSTTFAPVEGPAEQALVAVMRALPSVHFDVITAGFSSEAMGAQSVLPNVTVHRIGSGAPSDKYLLPVLGAAKGRELIAKHSYLFIWAVMASYGALAAADARRGSGLPLLITLADQKLASVPLRARLFMRFILSGADQVSAIDAEQQKSASRIAPAAQFSASNRLADAFANAVRFAYNDALRRIRNS